MLKQIRITNFKSLEDVTVILEPVTVLIGRSGSGKTNFVQAIRWLRDCLSARDAQIALQAFGNEWGKVNCATARQPFQLSFSVTFDAPGFTVDFTYELVYQAANQQHPNAGLSFFEEKLTLGKDLLFHQRESKWVQPPPLIQPPPPGQIMLGAITGLQEATIAHLVLTNGIGCYSFPDTVLSQLHGTPQSQLTGLKDDGNNFVSTFAGIINDLRSWKNLQEIAASLRRLKRNLKNIDIDQPGRQNIAVTLEVEKQRLVLNLAQESEGFRRLLACLLAIYQEPPKQTVIFDEPEKGIYLAGLAILAEEFQNYAERGRGQVILTTHSPEFLDHFKPEQIRVVEMKGYATQIGPVSSDQVEMVREKFLRPGELLTVDLARLDTPAAVQ